MPDAEPQLGRQILKQFIKYVGLDVHKETIADAVADADGGRLRRVGEIGNTPQAVEKPVESNGSGTN